MQSVMEITREHLSLWAHIYYNFPEVSYVKTPFWPLYSREQAACLFDDPRKEKYRWSKDVAPQDQDYMRQMDQAVSEGAKGLADPSPAVAENYLRLTHTAYEQHALDYSATIVQHAPLDKMLLEFSRLISPHGKIIDAGCGPGQDILKFLEQGKDPTGLDASEAMVRLAEKTTQVPVYCMDLLDLEKLKTTWEGIWCVATLVHLQRKDAPLALEVFNRVLQPRGYVFLSVKQGIGSQLIRREKIKGAARFFTYFEKEEMQQYLDRANFDIQKQFLYVTYRHGIGWDVWLNILARKQP